MLAASDRPSLLGRGRRDLWNWAEPTQWRGSNGGIRDGRFSEGISPELHEGSPYELACIWHLLLKIHVSRSITIISMTITDIYMWRGRGTDRQTDTHLCHCAVKTDCLRSLPTSGSHCRHGNLGNTETETRERSKNKKIRVGFQQMKTLWQTASCFSPVGVGAKAHTEVSHVGLEQGADPHRFSKRKNSLPASCSLPALQALLSPGAQHTEIWEEHEGNQPLWSVMKCIDTSTVQVIKALLLTSIETNVCHSSKWNKNIII